MGVKCPDSPGVKAVLQSVGPAFETPVPPSRGQQAEQVVSRMEVVPDDPLCSGEASRAGNVFQGGQRTADCLFS